MVTRTDQFEIELRKLISAEIERLTAIMTGGMGVSDFSDYKLRVGEIRALNWVADHLDDVRIMLEKMR